MFEALNNELPSTIKEGIELDKLEYKNLKDFIGKSLFVDGFYFNTKGKFGKQVVVIAHENGGVNYSINVPSRCLAQFETIAKDDAMLDAVLHGGLIIDEIEPCDTANGATTIFKFKG